MKRVVVTILMLALAIGVSGCGEKKDENVTIIGGADGPTSIYLAPSSSENEFRYADPIDGDEYYMVMDRILGEYGLDGQEWGTAIDLKGETDAVVTLAMDSTGRYKAFGIISKEAGCYGIILDDTIDGTQDNVNYSYEVWAYTGKTEEKPEFKWEDDQLYFTYPVQRDKEIEITTVPIDCGYDTGHMEFNMERKDMASENQEDVLSGTWQTASVGYEADGEMQPEYYVQFAGLQINYGHMKDGEFIVDHTDDISYLEETEPGKYIVQAESSTGVQYTLKTAESDNDVLEYYETWNEDEFPDAYRGGATLTRCN
ncbi:MAG: hypothetical protein IJJ64_03750 [Butyrivibrio sp.]|nr:hypothetical protein [Butyrivibrio sp.]